MREGIDMREIFGGQRDDRYEQYLSLPVHKAYVLVP